MFAHTLTYTYTHVHIRHIYTTHTHTYTHTLTQDSMENMHNRHLPRLLLVLVEQLAGRGQDLSLSELYQCLELALSILRELKDSPLARSTTPHTPSTPLFTTGMPEGSGVGRLSRQDSSQSDSALTQGQQLETDFELIEVKNGIRDHYLRFFEQFLRQERCGGGREEGGKAFSAADLVVKGVPKEVECCYEATYKLLLQVHMYVEGEGGNVGELAWRC